MVSSIDAKGYKENNTAIKININMRQVTVACRVCLCMSDKAGKSRLQTMRSNLLLSMKGDIKKFKELSVD